MDRESPNQSVRVHMFIWNFLVRFAFNNSRSTYLVSFNHLIGGEQIQKASIGQ